MDWKAQNSGIIKTDDRIKKYDITFLEKDEKSSMWPLPQTHIPFEIMSRLPGQYNRGSWKFLVYEESDLIWVPDGLYRTVKILYWWNGKAAGGSSPRHQGGSVIRDWLTTDGTGYIHARTRCRQYADKSLLKLSTHLRPGCLWNCSKSTRVSPVDSRLKQSICETSSTMLRQCWSAPALDYHHHWLAGRQHRRCIRVLAVLPGAAAFVIKRKQNDKQVEERR